MDRVLIPMLKPKKFAEGAFFCRKKFPALNCKVVSNTEHLITNICALVRMVLCAILHTTKRPCPLMFARFWSDDFLLSIWIIVRQSVAGCPEWVREVHY